MALDIKDFTPQDSVWSRKGAAVASCKAEFFLDHSGNVQLSWTALTSRKSSRNFGWLRSLGGAALAIMATVAQKASLAVRQKSGNQGKWTS